MNATLGHIMPILNPMGEWCCPYIHRWAARKHSGCPEVGLPCRIGGTASLSQGLVAFFGLATSHRMPIASAVIAQKGGEARRGEAETQLLSIAHVSCLTWR